MTGTTVLVPRRRDQIAARMHARQDAWCEVQPDADGHTAYLRERQHIADAAAHRVAEEALEALRDAGIPLSARAHAVGSPAANAETRPCERAASSRAAAGLAEATRTRQYITEAALERIGQVEAVQSRLASIYQRAWQRHSRNSGAPLNATVTVNRAELPEFLRAQPVRRDVLVADRG